VDDDGRDLRPGQAGELLVRAPGMMRGYLGRPDETAATLRGDWLHTGDLARADERGFLYFMGRTKDIIRRSGENVSASEVEAVLRAHPLVNEAAVLPVADDLRGEEVIAHVEVVEGHAPGDVPPAELVGFRRARLAKHKVPRYIAYRSEPFPRTPSMRVKKSDLRAAGVDLAAVWDREREPAA